MLNQTLSKKRKGFAVLMKALMLLSVGLTAILVLFLLAIVKHAVQYHRGKIFMVSEPNKGTTISVWLNA